MRKVRAVIGVSFAIVVAACTAQDSVGPDVAPRNHVDLEASAVRVASGVRGSVKVYCINATSCFAVAYDFTDNRDDPLLGRSTVFSVYIQNLQGTYPEDGPSTPLNLNRFRFRFFDTQESPDFVDAYPIETISAVGNVQAGVNNDWSNDSPIAGLNSDLFSAEIGSGILGCDVAAANPPLFFTFRTCLSEGLDGWVRVDFVLWHNGSDPSNAPVRLHDFEFAFGDGFSAGHYCTIGGEQPATCTVLPYSKVVSP